MNNLAAKNIRALCFLLLASFCFGGEVRLKDGTVLVGEIQDLFQNTLQVKTAVLGVVKIPKEQVVSFRSDKPVNYYDNAKVIQTVQKTEYVLNGENTGAEMMDLAQVDVLWAEGEKNPALPVAVKAPRVKWGVEASLDLNKKKGNTDKSSNAAGVVVTADMSESLLKMYANGVVGKEDGRENERKFLAGVDFERNYEDDTRRSWYARAEYEYDKFGGFDPKISGVGGYGYYPVRSENLEIRLRAGLALVYKDYISEAEDDGVDLALDLEYHHCWKFNRIFLLDCKGEFITDIVFMPVIDDPADDWTLKHSSALSFPLGGSEQWSIRLGISHDVNRKVPKGTKRTDTTYFARLVWKYR